MRFIAFACVAGIVVHAFAESVTVAGLDAPNGALATGAT